MTQISLRTLMKIKIDVLLPIVFVLPIVVLLIGAIYSGSSTLVFLLGGLLFVIGFLAQQRNSVLDLVFFGAIGFIVAPSVILLDFYPEISVFDGGKFQLVDISADTIDRGLFLLVGIVSGWASVLFLDKNSEGRLRRQIVLPDRFVWILVRWFLASVVVVAFGAVMFSINVAGVESDSPFSGLLFYAFPADFIALILAAGLGCRTPQIERQKVFVVALLIAYLVVKIIAGWKSPLLNVSLAYLVGAYSGGRVRNLWKIVLISIFVASFYVTVIRPIVEIIRNGEIVSEGLFQSETNPLSNRLTDSNFQGLSVIQTRGFPEGISFGDFLKDFINRLVPGTIFDVQSVDRIFTENVLGQAEGVSSTFAPGVLGTVEFLGGFLAAFLYGFVFRAMVYLATTRFSCCRQGLGKLFVLATFPVFIVSFVVDGYTGGLERLLPAWFIIAVALNVVTVFIRFFSWRITRESVQLKE